jgi:competence protein ComEA
MDRIRTTIGFPLLFTLALFLVPAQAFAALININTADVVLLDTLPGIGPTKAQAIVDYRTAHGPFAKIEDIQNVTGIGPSTYTQIAPFITVGESASGPSPVTSVAATSTVPESKSSKSNRPPPPPSLRVEILGDDHAYPHVPLEFTIRARASDGDEDTDAQYTWGFGDGSEAVGKTVRKSFEFPGEYMVTVYARHGNTVGKGSLLVRVTTPTVRIVAVSADGVTVQNESNDTLDVSEWVLRTSDNSSYRLPVGTVLAARGSVLFPASITRLRVTGQSVLLYPSGGVAAAFPEVAAVMQPTSESVGSHSEQTVEPAAITPVNRTAHAIEPVIAPASATTVTLAGASTSVPAPAERGRGLFASPWALGFLGVLTMAGAALLVL